MATNEQRNKEEEQVDTASFRTLKELLVSHECRGVVVTCIDFRFWETSLVKFVKERLGFSTFDILTAPGAIKGLVENDEVYGKYILNGLGVSRKLHEPSTIILIQHSTCGAYGITDAEKELARHKEDLAKARAILVKEFPNIKIRTFIARGKPEKEEIAYEETL